MPSLRVVAVALVVLVGGAVAAAPLSDTGVLNAGSAQDDATLVDSCGTITESGTYELDSDLLGNDGACLHVRASGVTVDGNGHTVAGDGADGSVGVLVYAGAHGESTDDSLGDVTVRNVTVTGWERGVQVGDIRGLGTEATLRDVTASSNGAAGVYLVEAEDATVDGLTATDNDNGVALWEVQDSTLTDVTASDNAQRGVALWQDVYDVELRGVAATGNGDGSFSAGGVYLSTDARRNTVADAVLSDNDGAGLRFSDSGENVVRNVVAADNTGPGVHGIPASDELLRNVTARGNGGPALRVAEGELNATDFRVGGGVSAAFEREGVTLDRVAAGDRSAPQDRDYASPTAVNVTGVETGVEVTVGDVAGPAVELWRYDGTWTRVADTTYDEAAETVTGTVREDGVVAAVQVSQQNGQTTTPPTTTASTTDEPPATTDSTTTAPTTTVEPTTTEPTTSAPTTTTDRPTTTAQPPADDEASTLAVLSTRDDHDFAYIVVVEGDAAKSSTDDVAADSGDSVLDNGDGTVTIVGTTGDESGDAFRIEGDVVSFYTPADRSDYAVELDGEDVTDDLPGPR